MEEKVVYYSLKCRFCVLTPENKLLIYKSENNNKVTTFDLTRPFDYKSLEEFD